MQPDGDDGSNDIWTIDLVRGVPSRFTFSPDVDDDPVWSPDGDGKWVAYTSDESGRNEVFVQSFPDSHEKVQISTRGGVSPQRAPSGRELYFLSIDRRLMAVTLNLANPLQVRTPMPLFDTSVGLGANRYAPARGRAQDARV